MVKSDSTREAKQNERVRLDSIRAKVILGFLLFGVALAVSFLVIRFTMREMINTVDELSSPNYTLVLADNLFNRIVKLEQDQRTKALLQRLPPEKLIDGSTDIHQYLDTLAFMLYTHERQLERIDSMHRLLDEHDRIFLQYLKIRAEMSNDQSLVRKSDELSALLQRRKDADSSVVSLARVTTTTIMFPEEEEELSFFERLFRSGRDHKPELPQPDRIVRTEENVKIDTVPKPRKDSLIIHEAMSLMAELKTEQQSRNVQLVREEHAMLTAINDLTGSLLKLCHDLQEAEIRKERAEIDSLTVILQNGLEKYVLFIFVFFLGSALIVFLILLDISRSAYYRRNLEMAREEAERLGNIKQRFLANMSHEIRTPLQSIVGFSEQMVHYPDQLTPVSSNAIYQSSRHLLHVVNEVLDFSKLESGKFNLDNKPFNMDSVVREVAEVVSPQCKGKGLEFRCHIDFGSLRDAFVTGDPFRLKQILFNLLGNAVKFTREGFVTLESTCRLAEGEVEFNFTIGDSGRGIPEKDQQRIFRLFEQVSQDGAPQDGIGLGLSIVQALVKAKGGLITLLSEQGKGSRFQVSVCYPIAKRPSVYPSNGPGYPLISARRVIMIDDDSFILELCRTIINRRGLRFDQYQSAEDFLASDWSAADESLIVLVDVRLPGISGSELSGRVRQTLQDRVRLVAVTALTGNDTIETLLECGFDRVLMKPFREHELLAALSDGSVLEPCPDLLKMAGDDPDQVREFLEIYLADCNEDVKSMRAHFEKGDLASVTGYIHRLAGRCGQFGALDWARKFRMLEIGLRQDHQSDPNALELPEMLDGFARFLVALEKEVGDSVSFEN